VRMHVLRIVPMDKMFCFVNTLTIIIKYIASSPPASSSSSVPYLHLWNILPCKFRASVTLCFSSSLKYHLKAALLIVCMTLCVCMCVCVHAHVHKLSLFDCFDSCCVIGCRKNVQKKTLLMLLTLMVACTTKENIINVITSDGGMYSADAFCRPDVLLV